MKGAVVADLAVVVSSGYPAGRVEHVMEAATVGRTWRMLARHLPIGRSGVKLCLLLIVLPADRPPTSELTQRIAIACD